MADWGAIGNMLQGVGAGFSGTLPQYLQGKAAEEEAAFLKDERRRKALIQDFTKAYVLGQNGNWDAATRLLENRHENIVKLGGDPRDTMGLLEMARDPNRRQEALSELGGFYQAAVAAGEVELPGGGVEGAKRTDVFKNGAVLQTRSDGSIVLTTPSGGAIGPSDPGWQEAISSATGSGIQYAGDEAAAKAAGAGNVSIQIDPIIASLVKRAEAGVELSTKPEIERTTQAAKDAQEKSNAYLDKVDKVREGFFAIDDAITAIDEGANSGRIADLFPTIRANSLNLENAGRRMGLGVIQSATFGALSEGEMKLAMETALPKLPPAELRVYLTNKKAAQAKYADYLESAAIYLSKPGNTAATWAEEQKALREQQKGGQRGTQAPAGGSTRKIVRRGKDQATGRPVVQYDDGTIEAQ